MNQKLIDLLNMASGDQKYIYEFGEGGQIVVDDSYDYETKIFTILWVFIYKIQKNQKAGITIMVLLLNYF